MRFQIPRRANIPVGRLVGPGLPTDRNVGPPWAGINRFGCRLNNEGTWKVPLLSSYSCRSATMGSSLAARRAGAKPKTIPTAVEKKKAIRLILGSKV